MNRFYFTCASKRHGFQGDWSKCTAVFLQWTHPACSLKWPTLESYYIERETGGIENLMQSEPFFMEKSFLFFSSPMPMVFPMSSYLTIHSAPRLLSSGHLCGTTFSWEMQCFTTHADTVHLVLWLPRPQGNLKFIYTVHANRGSIQVWCASLHWVRPRVWVGVWLGLGLGEGWVDTSPDAWIDSKIIMYRLQVYHVQAFQV